MGWFWSTNNCKTWTGFRRNWARGMLKINLSDGNTFGWQAYKALIWVVSLLRTSVVLDCCRWSCWLRPSHRAMMAEKIVLMIAVSSVDPLGWCGRLSFWCVIHAVLKMPYIVLFHPICVWLSKAAWIHWLWAIGARFSMCFIRLVVIVFSTQWVASCLRQVRSIYSNSVLF